MGDMAFNHFYHSNKREETLLLEDSNIIAYHHFLQLYLAMPKTVKLIYHLHLHFSQLFRFIAQILTNMIPT
jgi:hypothetical protein